MDKDKIAAPKMTKGLPSFIFYCIQFTWGLPVNLIGGLGFLVLKLFCEQEKYCNCYITYVKVDGFGGVSLGMFTFINKKDNEEWLHNTRIHEYGHTIQCLFLGPLYWFVIGIPSFVWCVFLTPLHKEKNSYYRFYPEKWANTLGQKWSKTKMKLE